MKKMKRKFLLSKLVFSPLVFCPLLIAYSLSPIVTFAQNDSQHIKHKIAIFVPLYLDSAFGHADEYRYAKNVLPKFINPGLEFYEGAQLAFDSLSKEGNELEVFIYDTRSSRETLEEQLNKPELKDAELIIAHCSGNEVRVFADAGLKKNIPVINTTVPNDAGTTGNPFFVVLNPTLRTQCEGIYKYIQKYYAIEPIVVFRKKGTSSDPIKTYFDEYGKVTMSIPLKMKYVDLTDSFSVNLLKPYLDTAHRTLCIAGSLDANFGKRLALQLASVNARYPCVIMGMPTWDGIKEFNKPDFKGPEIIYSTPFYNARTDKISQGINNYFTNTMYARPSDMVFRGYEVTWKFAKLLLQYGKELSSNLGNKQVKVFTDFEIQPVINKQNRLPDYFENKKLYFIKWQDGIIKSVN
jgi:hypothetical protein